MKIFNSYNLINTTSLNLETILFTDQCFPRVNTVKLTERMIHQLEESDRHECGSILSLNEDLLFGTTIQISSVAKFSIPVCRFLCLFPNLVDLELNLGHPLVRDLVRLKEEQR